MRRPSSRLLAVLICTVLFGAACGSDSDPDETGDGDTAATAAAGERIDTEVGEALVWGDGDSGVVLAHGAAYDAESWTDQATRIAAEGATVVAVEDISPEGIEAAVTYLKDERGIDGVALIGASAGADGILDLVSQQPDLPDQIILVSPNSVVDELGVSPKLFIASEDEPVADVSSQLAENADGDENEALLLPGSTHAQGLFKTDQAEPVMTAILDRLKQFAA